MRRLFVSMGIVLETLPGTASGPYLGSLRSTPIYAHFAALLDNQRRHSPEAHRLVTLGAGLDLETPTPRRSSTGRAWWTSRDDSVPA